ncbi:phage holin family protein [Pseudahrensia aquimaris]|uniref:Phage holin family protein n=1 Tax=Pseudahrensia aquimaris TaxID=744461 RepID=A0ABW3FI68_9HYPH
MTKNLNTMVETVRELFQDSTLLVRQEIQLAKAEAAEKAEQVKLGVAEIAAGGIIALVALIVLTQALVVALANFMPGSLAALLVGVSLALVAWLCISRGQRNLSSENLAPRRTTRSVRETANRVTEAV